MRGVHKFVAPACRRQNILQTASAVLRGERDTIPALATTEAEFVTLYWWCEPEGHWMHWQRKTTGPASTTGQMDALRDQAWSAAVGLVASSNRVYLFYKRQPVGFAAAKIPFYVETFALKPGTGRLSTPDELGLTPTLLPLSGRQPSVGLGFDGVGFEFWVAADKPRGRLLILLQRIIRETTFHVLPTSGFGFGPGIGFLHLGEPTHGPWLRRPPSLNSATRISRRRDPRGDSGEAASAAVRTMPPIPTFTRPFGPVGKPEMPHPLDFAFTSIVTADLVLLSTQQGADLLAQRELGLVSSWNAPLRIDDGGYDFDALLRPDSRLHVVYRRESHAVSVDLTFGPHPSSEQTVIYTPSLSTAVTAPLHYRQVSTATATPTLLADPGTIYDDIPGADQVQLHSADPIRVTGERLLFGQFHVESAIASRQRTVDPSLMKAEKVMIQRRADGSGSWSTWSLLRYEPGRVPRSYASAGLTPWAVDADWHRLYWSSLYRARQVHQVMSAEERKQDSVAFLIAVYGGDDLGQWEAQAWGFLGRLFFRFDSRVAGGQAYVEAWQAIDLAHEQIRHPSGAAPQLTGIHPDSNENAQFAPLYVRLAQASAVAKRDGTDVASDPTVYAVCNTIGGHVSVVRDANEQLIMLSYTDLGDGGARVLYSSNGMTIPPATPSTKDSGVPPERLVRALEDQPVTLSAESWKPTSLPTYRVVPWTTAIYGDLATYDPPFNPTATPPRNPGSLASGIQPAADGLFALANYAVGQSGDVIQLSLADIGQMEGVLASQDLADKVTRARGGWPVRTRRVTSSAEPGYPTAVLDVDPPVQLAQNNFFFDSSSSTDPHYTITRTWAISGPGDVVTSQPDGTPLTEWQFVSQQSGLAHMPDGRAPAVVGAVIIPSPDAVSFYQSLSVGNYLVELTVSNQGGESDLSLPAVVGDATTPSPPPFVATHFVSQDGSPALEVRWGSPQGGAAATGYRIYRRDAQGGNMTYDTSAAETAARVWVDGPLPLGDAFEYQVRTLAGLAQSEPSPFTNAVVMPDCIVTEATVEDLRISDRITWINATAPSNYALMGYHVFRRSTIAPDWQQCTDSPVRSGSAAHTSYDIQRPDTPRDIWSYAIVSVVRLLNLDGAPIGAPFKATWSAPFAGENVAAPRALSVASVAGRVHLTWVSPSYLDGATSGYRVYRRALGTQGLTLLGRVADDVRMYDDTPPTAGTFAYYVVALNAGLQSSKARTVVIARHLWDDLWEVFRTANNAAGRVSFTTLRFDVGAYNFAFQPGPYFSEWTRHDNRGQAYLERRMEFALYTKVLTVTRLPYWSTEYRFTETQSECRFVSKLSSDEITLALLYRPFLSIDSFSATTWYARPFTVGVLMSDTRGRDPLNATPLIDPQIDTLVVPLQSPSDDCPQRYVESALCAKPVGPTTLAASVDLKLSLTVAGRIALSALASMIGLAAVIIALGIAAAFETAGQTAFYQALIDWINPATLTALVMATIVVANLGFIPALEWYIESSVADKLSASDQKRLLDDQLLIWFSGEGLAEALARAFIDGLPRPTDGTPPPLVPDDHGRTRFLAQSFQTVVINNGRAEARIRLP